MHIQYCSQIGKSGGTPAQNICHCTMVNYVIFKTGLMQNYVGLSLEMGVKISMKI